MPLAFCLQGHHFKVNTLVETPYITHLDLDSVTGKYDIGGSFADLLNNLAAKMNFTYTIKPPPDNKWGGQLADGTWNGMMYQVTNELIDFGKVVKINATKYVR